MKLKLFFKNSTRRVEFVDSAYTYLGLSEFLERTFQIHLGFSIKYRDDENDLCTISSDLALHEAMRLYPNVLKLTIDANLDDDDFGFVMVANDPPEGWEMLQENDAFTTVSPPSSPTLCSLFDATTLSPSPRAVQIHSPSASSTTSSASSTTSSTPTPVSPSSLAPSPTSASTPVSSPSSASSSPSPTLASPSSTSEKSSPPLEKKAPELLPVPDNLDELLGFKAVAVDRILWQYGRYRVKISADGDCAFASVAQQLAASGGGSFTVQELRQIFCDEITSNFSQWQVYFPGTSAAEIGKFRSKGHWDSDLGDAVIIVLCLMFQVDCIIYRHDRRVVHCWSEGLGKSPVLHVAHHCAHFDATRPISCLAA